MYVDTSLNLFQSRVDISKLHYKNINSNLKLNLVD